MVKSSLNIDLDIDYKILKDVPVNQIQALYKSINWKEKTEETLNDYLLKSIVVITAWDKELLVGIARATTNASREVTIWDVAVRPEYQKKGIGSKIMKCMLTILDDLGVPVVTLYADPGKEQFYEKFSFVPHKSKLMAMIRKN